MKISTWMCAAALVTASCGGKKSDSDHKGGGTEDQKPTKALAADFFGKVPGPVGILKKVKFGASVADARKAAPELFDEPDPKRPDKTKLAHDPELADLMYSIGFDHESLKVQHMYIEVPATTKAMLATAWGAGKDAKDTIDRPRTYWFDPATGWRAWTENGFDPKDMNVSFSPYVPAAKLLGDGQDQLGFAPQGVLGASLDDLRKKFPDTIVETDQKSADQNRKDLNKMMGSDVSKDLGGAKPSVDLALPPTEWAEYTTSVHTTWTDDGHVQEVWFALDYRAYPNAKTEIRALLDKKWPNGKPGKWIVDDATVSKVNDHYVVAITDDTISKAWDVHVSSSAKMTE